MYIKVVGYTILSLGVLILLVAGCTLWGIWKRKSLRQLRFITGIICMTNLINILSGILLVKQIWVGEANDGWLFFLAISKSLHDLGIFCVVWLVSFKYWESVRQMTHYVRIVLPNAETLEKEDNQENKSKGNLEQNHKRYALWKWIIIGIAILGRIVLGYFLYIEDVWYSNNNESHNWTFVVVIGCFDLFYFSCYVACLVLLFSAVKMLKLWLNDLTGIGLNKNAACKHIMVAMLVCLSSTYYQITSMVAIVMCVKTVDQNKSQCNERLRLIAELAEEICQFIAFIILLYMIWEYTLIQELCEKEKLEVQQTPQTSTTVISTDINGDEELSRESGHLLPLHSLNDSRQTGYFGHEIAHGSKQLI